MSLSMFVMSVALGLFAAWLAGIAVKGGGYGPLCDVVLGLGGSVLGAWLFQTLAAPEAGSGATSIAAFGGAALAIVAQRRIRPAPAHA